MPRLKKEYNHIFAPPLGLHGLLQGKYTFIFTSDVKLEAHVIGGVLTDRYLNSWEVTLHLFFPEDPNIFSYLNTKQFVVLFRASDYGLGPAKWISVCSTTVKILRS
jgi:hypothetical protein